MDQNRGVDYPKPESDLAQWATKIKAMQRQVDADEEVEQRRLEAEITAARQARMRRSRQFSGKSGNVEGSPRSPAKWNLPSPTADDDRPRDTAERTGYHNDALKKLMGNNSVHVPAAPPTEAVSLAAFMGGRATGPRLNRHAAQQDAHDPTQFSQPDTSTPHPIFGKGGVAMPGMVSKPSLNGGRMAGKTASLVSQPLDQKPALSETKYNSLRAPTAVERRRSVSPTPAFGTEDFERYRPTRTPSPQPPLNSKKSSDGGWGQSYRGHAPQKSIDRASTPTLRSQKSSDRALRPQKSSERITPASVGTEDFERYRPSTSPQPSFLKSQKSSTNLSPSVEASTNQRPRSGSALSSARPTTPGSSSTKPFAEKRSDSPFKRSASPQKRPTSPEKQTRFDLPRSPSQEMKTTKPWVRDPPVISPSPNTPSAVVSSKSNLWNAPVADPRPQNNSFTSVRERTMSTPSYLSRPAAAPTATKTTVAPPPSLARPIQPEPRVASNARALPAAAVVASPAFLRASTADLTKDVSPSISRLQGRGFVQNMVKANATRQLEPFSAPSSAPSTPAERSRSVGGKKSVLDRWQPQNRNRSTSPPPSPIKSYTPSSAKRATTADFSSNKDQRSTPMSVTPPGRSQTPKVNEQRAANATPSFGTPLQSNKANSTVSEPLTPRTTARFLDKMAPTSGKIGSATTMFVERPATVKTVPVVDELGVKHDIPSIGRRFGGIGGENGSSTNKYHITSDGIPAPTGKPLTHPTKNRAKRPKKNSFPPDNNSTSISLTEEPEEIAAVVEEPPREFEAPVREQRISVTLERKSSVDSKVGRLAETWTSIGPILPNRTPIRRASSEDAPRDPKPNKYAGLRQALPGLAKESAVPRPTTPEKKASPPDTSGKRASPVSPGRQRIPSTGNRATVMEVAQAMHEAHLSDSDSHVPRPASPTTRLAVLPASVLVDENDNATISRPRTLPGLQNAERRVPSYDRFSIAMLPPLREEATPASTPMGTLTRSKADRKPYPEKEEQEPEMKVEEQEQGVDSALIASAEPQRIVIEHEEAPVDISGVDILAMLQSLAAPSSGAPENVKTISVEVLSVTGPTSTTLAHDTDIFYDSEVLAIVHRAKSPSSGLVDTSVYCWVGKRARYGEQEERKVQEIARRYGTAPIVSKQCSEPIQLVKLLGGRLAIRQGMRSLWSSDNTAMHLVRRREDVIIIDEHDLNIKNLCSAFSYCLTILNTVYLWHGVGSVGAEQAAATAYAQSLAKDGDVVVLHEGQDSQEQDDSMFWMILGEEAFANADYWRWRPSMSPPVEPRVWRVHTASEGDTVRVNHQQRCRGKFEPMPWQLVPVEFGQEKEPGRSVYIVDCIWEAFVLVGVDARGSRRDIRLALDIALEYVQRVAPSRPFTPNVHAVIFPSQLPLDLRMHFRDLDETLLNQGDIPDHMNIVSSAEAYQHLDSVSWMSDALKHHDMLPLGVEASVLKST